MNIPVNKRYHVVIVRLTSRQGVCGKTEGPEASQPF